MLRRLLSDTWTLCKQVVLLRSSREVYVLLTIAFIKGVVVGAVFL
jgi:hypothetical protein